MSGVVIDRQADVQMLVEASQSKSTAAGSGMRTAEAGKVGSQQRTCPGMARKGSSNGGFLAGRSPPFK